MASSKLWAKIPLIGMSMVFLAMAIVAVTAYLHAGWYSAIGYAAFLRATRDTEAPG